MLQENQNIARFVHSFSKSDHQINEVFESDAELIRLEEHKILALTSDNIVEEIESGLYTDPYQIGWMAVTVNMSDLAAVGARPLGINLSLNIPGHTDQGFLDKISKGIEDACKLYRTNVLGGDTNGGKELLVGGTAIGILDDSHVLMRRGAGKGDYLFATGNLGQGNVFAYEKLILKNKSASFFPKARLEEGSIIRQHASSCIDTSDGFFPALSNLIEINNKGFKLSEDLNHLVDEELCSDMIASGVPPWIFLAGPHGEFELLFTVPEQSFNELSIAARKINWAPICLGRTINNPQLEFGLEGISLKYDPFKIANLFTECGMDPHKYFKELLKINKSWMQQLEHQI
jgi:thiamine-monophosphate kinase